MCTFKEEDIIIFHQKIHNFFLVINYYYIFVFVQADFITSRQKKMEHFQVRASKSSIF